jgi:hypothetical protein
LLVRHAKIANPLAYVFENALLPAVSADSKIWLSGLKYQQASKHFSSNPRSTGLHLLR